jgi:hypothetical protein
VSAVIRQIELQNNRLSLLFFLTLANDAAKYWLAAARKSPPLPRPCQALPTEPTGLGSPKDGWGSMFRVRFVVSAATIAMSAALAACSSTPSWVPDWMSLGSSTPQLVTMQFESQPQGADVRTGQGQTCQTPCSLALQPQSQAVSFSKNGFLPQTVQIGAGEPAEHSLFQSAPPTLSPNPVTVVLQPAGPPPRSRAPMRPVRPKPHRAPAVAAPPPPPGQSSPFPPPPKQ